MSSSAECIKCGRYIHHGPVVCSDCLKEHDSRIATKAAKAGRERILQAISESLKTCAFYDDMISGEGGCPGKRNCESKCDGCSYFEIDGNQLNATIESLKEGME